MAKQSVYPRNVDEMVLLRRALKKVRFPKGVRRWESEFREDSTGDDAVWIWLIVDDDLGEDPAFMAQTTRISREVLRAVQEVGLERWPYLRIRTVSEQEELKANTK